MASTATVIALTSASPQYVKYSQPVTFPKKDAPSLSRSSFCLPSCKLNLCYQQMSNVWSRYNPSSSPRYTPSTSPLCNSLLSQSNKNPCNILSSSLLGTSMSPLGDCCSLRRRHCGRTGRTGLIRAARGEPIEPHAATASSVISSLDDVATAEFLDPGYFPAADGREVGLEEFLETELPRHPKLFQGMLDNGLKYVILPNQVPQNRFEAHLEMHVGSVDELEHEQGVAHMIEHVTFLGSKKREKLLGTGARSNAYTDFHHTVFHVHSPVWGGPEASGDFLLPSVLEALREIAFQPQFLPSRIEKERRAVLSELQMMNTIEYRVDCQLLQQLHGENLLSRRFPIGLEEQIKSWDLATIKAFHSRWYFPANATLYVVGDFTDPQQVVEAIESEFGPEPPGVHPSANGAAASPPATSAPPPQQPRFPFPFQRGPGSFFNPFGGSAKAAPAPSGSTGAVTGVRKERHAVRPPVLHRWSPPEAPRTQNGYPAKEDARGKPHIFQHELLQNFSMSIFCKTPVRPVQRYGDLRNALMQRVVLSALQFRITNRYKSGSPPFLGIDMDHSDSGREACTVSTLTVTAQPQHWQGALKVAMQEVHRLRAFGVTAGELTRYLGALVKDSEQLAAMCDAIPSLDNLDFVMESLSVGHTVMDQQQSHGCLQAVAASITLDDVNAVGQDILSFVADYGKVGSPVPSAVVACVPANVHSETEGRDIPFRVTAEEIDTVIVEGLKEPIFPEPEVIVPQALISLEEISRKKEKTGPAFVPIADTATRFYDAATGVIQKRLSNGVKVNMKITQNEASGGVLRLVTPGGRALERAELEGDVVLGVRTLSEAGTVGDFDREQVELFCVSNLINCVLEADEEFLCMDFHFTTRDGGLAATFQLIHMVLEHNVWQEDALSRARQLYLSHFRSIPKSLERATAYKLMAAMFGSDRRLMDPTPQALASLTLPAVRDAVLRQLMSGNLELTIVGDFDESEVDTYLLDYLGTVTFTGANQGLPGGDSAAVAEEADPLLVPSPLRILTNQDKALLNQRVLLRDTDERARAYIAGAAPNRWGLTQDGKDLNVVREPVLPTLTEEEAMASTPMGATLVKGDNGALFWERKRHPLYASVALSLLAEIVNARLFTTVRDTLGLTYDVSFEISLLDRLHLGWFVVSVTSTPAKIDQALEASLNVIRGLKTNRINQRELDRARRTLLMRHESDQKDNGYWLGLLTHLQSDQVPRKDVGCIKDLAYLYYVTSTEDVYNAYTHLSVDKDSLFTCVGVAGQHVEVFEKEAGVVILDVSEDEESDALPQMHGRGMSTMTRPTT